MNAIATALALLLRIGVTDVPPVTLVDAPPNGAHATAYRLIRNGEMEPVIYVVRTTPTFQRAERGDTVAVIMLASTLVHERMHGLGAGEREAYSVQVTALEELLRLHQPLRFSQLNELLRHMSHLRAQAALHAEENR